MAKNQAAATAALAAAAAGADATQPPQPEETQQDAAADAAQPRQPEDTQPDDAADATQPEAEKTPPRSAQKRVRARVLVDGRFGSVNDVVEVDGETLDGARGELCAHPASVAYAQSLK